MAGPIINDFEQLRSFVCEVLLGIDEYEYKRVKLREKLFEFDDGNACRRLVNNMGLKK